MSTTIPKTAKAPKARKPPVRPGSVHELDLLRKRCAEFEKEAKVEHGLRICAEQALSARHRLMVWALISPIFTAAKVDQMAATKSIKAFKAYIERITAEESAYQTEVVEFLEPAFPDVGALNDLKACVKLGSAQMVLLTPDVFEHVKTLIKSTVQAEEKSGEEEEDNDTDQPEVVKETPLPM